MPSITRRAFIESAAASALSGALLNDTNAEASAERPADVKLEDGWLIQCSTLVEKGGEAVSRTGFAAKDWCTASVPSTVLNALVKNGIYPDPRIALNTYQIPDSSDEFNRKYDLSKFSHLPDKRNPWRVPYWYRTEFSIPERRRGQQLWLVFKGINYRADVWLNGLQLADGKTMVGMYQRFFLDGGLAKPGSNCLAVKVFPVDHPGTPSTQLKIFGKPRSPSTALKKDVTYFMGEGYDCMLPQPDRDMGLWQGVSLHFTGAVDIRNLFVITDLPLPDLKPAHLKISAEFVNVTPNPQSGVLRGSIPGAGIVFEKAVDLAPHETREVSLSPKEFPQLVVTNPRLWWPAGLGEQPLYELSLEFTIGKGISATATTKFGIRKITKELHIYEKWPGLRIYVNGQKVFCRGGWIQPDLLLNWDNARIDAEVRYFVHANLNTVSFEDIPMPADEFLDACDRYGVLFWNCFYGSWWDTPPCSNAIDLLDNPFTTPYAKPLPLGYKSLPLDHDLLEQCTMDIIKRYRNHPSLILYSCTGEGAPGRDTYQRWRKQVLALDDTRLFVAEPAKKCRFPWLEQDWPSGLNDAANFHLHINELKDYYEFVERGKEWMFPTEVPFMASVPPVDSLRRFIPDLWETKRGTTFPLNATWAHHGANSYFRSSDPFIRRDYGDPESVEDYCMKGHLVTAEHHRAVSEAFNHRMWKITSGMLEWKINSSAPDVQWQIYDWYLKPMPSLYYYRLAFEPLHLQYSYLDHVVTIVNQTLKLHNNLEAHAEMYGLDGNLLWEKRLAVNAVPNAYGDLFPIPPFRDIIGRELWSSMRPDQITPVYFLRLLLRDNSGDIISRNFYWLSAAVEADFRQLANLPGIKLEVAHTIESRGRETITRVTLRNPTDQVAFFVHTALLNGETGDEVLPVWWDDNYFSLIPGESREVCVRHASEDMKGVTPVIDVGGWNILSSFESSSLSVSRTEVKPGELFDVTASINKTSLDGSLVQLLVDGRPVVSKRIWARDGQIREVDFQLWLDETGSHSLQIGEQAVALSVVA